MMKTAESTTTGRGGVSATSLAYSFPGRTIWQDLAFTIDDGTFATLVGESGSGKTTLLQCLGSLERPTSGTLTVGGQEPAALRGAALRRFRRSMVGFAFQNAGLVPGWSVRKNIEVGEFRIARDPDRAREVFARFNLAYEFLGTPVYQLSGGEQQRVGIIRLALQSPYLLLMDEPTAALDDHNAGKVVDFITRHCAGGGIAVVATHDPRLIDASQQVIRL
ncbi:ABC transporter ATP-binding protein [Lolliginicoccus suaedae]|uniref:ABC transporter ATP-binding protein n=1 Tax=Lolliginicoccus suaedae TaxID=2605429 RepID=UPI0011EF777B|nr:ATP-binding cassette domain-containing protein [Lolliginicoccus suaedae]